MTFPKPGLFSLILFSLFACNNDNQQTTENADTTTVDTAAVKELSFVEKIETAHERGRFLAKEAIQYDFKLTFGGKERMNATITLLTNSTKGMIEMANGQKIIYDKEKVYHSPDMERNPSSIRFSAYTWAYFFLFPYKLSDPGTNWTDYPDEQLNERTYLTQKLTFAPGTGDDPKDWYIVYADSQSHLIDVAAYIVTAGKTVEEAEEDPHAIQYLDYREVEGIPISTRWLFWEWREEEGLTKQLGKAMLSNPRFVEVEENTFVLPEGFKKI